MSYQSDVAEAALSHPDFDTVNAQAIGDDHCEDPATVLRDINFLRGALAQATTFKPGDKVQFKRSYVGYFSHLKPIVLTVKTVHPKDPSTDGPSVTLEEIEEIHLINIDSLDLIERASK